MDGCMLSVVVVIVFMMQTSDLYAEDNYRIFPDYKAHLKIL